MSSTRPCRIFGLLFLAFAITRPAAANARGTCTTQRFNCAEPYASSCYIINCRTSTGPTLYEQKWCDGWIQRIDYLDPMNTYSGMEIPCTAASGGQGEGGPASLDPWANNWSWWLWLNLLN